MYFISLLFLNSQIINRLRINLIGGKTFKTEVDFNKNNLTLSVASLSNQRTVISIFYSLE